MENQDIMKQELIGAFALLKRLTQHGIDTIFGIPGGNNLPIYDALQHFNIRHILAKHEQGAGFMAQGMARATGKPAVCMATSGPGATNLITTISDAFSDSVPIIAITGNVAQELRGTEAFQEVDIVDMSKNITKKAFSINSANDIQKTIDEAFRIATSGRPGPVLIDIPKDVQLETCTWINFPIALLTSENDYSTNDIRSIRNMLQESQRPMIIAGHGIALSGASNELKILIEDQQIPVVTTLHGIGILPYNHPFNIGMAGMHGFKLANGLLAKSDLIIVLGARFDDRFTGNINEFCPDAKVIHIDINAKELNRLKAAHIAVRADLKDILSELDPFISIFDRTDWIKEVQALKKQFNGEKELKPESPEWMIRNISQIAEEDAIITTDVGQHQMWVAQCYQFSHPGQLLTSGGQGTMGFGLPAAIGASIANPDKQVICFTGDGSLMMNIQELATLTELQLNIKIIVLNNSALGMVKQQQQLFYNQNYSASRFGGGFNYQALAGAFGIDSKKMILGNEDMSRLNRWLKEPGASLIDIQISDREVVTPIMQPGKSVNAMMDCRKETLSEMLQ